MLTTEQKVRLDMLVDVTILPALYEDMDIYEGTKERKEALDYLRDRLLKSKWRSK